MDFGMLADLLIAEHTQSYKVPALIESDNHINVGVGAELTEEEFWTIVNILSQPRTAQVLTLNGVVLREAA